MLNTKTPTFMAAYSRPPMTTFTPVTFEFPDDGTPKAQAKRPAPPAKFLPDGPETAAPAAAWDGRGAIAAKQQPVAPALAAPQASTASTKRDLLRQMFHRR